jgi:hypothetical protein
MNLKKAPNAKKPADWAARFPRFLSSHWSVQRISLVTAAEIIFAEYVSYQTQLSQHQALLRNGPVIRSGSQLGETEPRPERRGSWFRYGIDETNISVSGPDVMCAALRGQAEPPSPISSPR